MEREDPVWRTNGVPEGPWSLLSRWCIHHDRNWCSPMVQISPCTWFPSPSHRAGDGDRMRRATHLLYRHLVAFTKLTICAVTLKWLRCRSRRVTILLTQLCSSAPTWPDNTINIQAISRGSWQQLVVLIQLLLYIHGGHHLCSISVILWSRPVSKSIAVCLSTNIRNSFS